MKAEAALIGSLIIDPDAIYLVAPLVAPEDFASSRWGTVYRAALALEERGLVVNYVTLCDELEAGGLLGKVGDANLTAAINLCPTSVYAAHYARSVAAAAMERRGRSGDPARVIAS